MRSKKEKGPKLPAVDLREWKGTRTLREVVGVGGWNPHGALWREEGGNEWKQAEGGLR
jgi:hypothetical protein